MALFNSNKLPTIRVFTPFFPHPRNEGAFITISEQSRRLRELGYQVQMVYWKGPNPTEQVLKTDFEGILVTRFGSAEPQSSTAGRILKSLFSKWSSAELFHYPPELLSEFQNLPHADLNIFNFSFAAPWLSQKRLSEKRL